MLLSIPKYFDTQVTNRDLQCRILKASLQDDDLSLDFLRISARLFVVTYRTLFATLLLVQDYPITEFLIERNCVFSLIAWENLITGHCLQGNKVCFPSQLRSVISWKLPIADNIQKTGDLNQHAFCQFFSFILYTLPFEHLSHYYLCLETLIISNQKRG